MDERVNDFLKEIEEIVPETSNTNSKRKRSHWKKCIDDNSGFPYYWNIKTDEVTWEAPSDYEDTTENTSKGKISSRINASVPDDVKIYKISKESLKIIKKEEKPGFGNLLSKEVNKTKITSDNNKDVPLVSSYGSGTESDEDENVQKNSNKMKTLSTLINEKVESNVIEEKLNKSSGFLLVAGYGGESEEEQEELVSTTSHSTLFPIVEPVDVSQFTNKKDDVTKNSPELEASDNVDMKAFQRKRRIDVPFINTTKKKAKLKESLISEIEEDKNTESTIANKSVQYPGFTSGGVLFNKEEIDKSKEPVTLTKDNEKDVTENLVEVNDVNINTIKGDIEKNKDTLKEKLTFLNEGRDTATIIQTMLIQMKTLYEAYESGSLMPNYLSSWLNDIASELVKLEVEATPAGWLLQWDRSQKRYFYCNIENGQTQWHYPVSDVNVSEPSDDAMDISMTPPPPEEDDKLELVPPPPPQISKAPTPPPPVISSSSDNVTESVKVLPKSDSDVSQKKADDIKDDSITSALNSFYSDIAAIETKVEKAETTDKSLEETSTNSKKKKVKVKLSQGLSMKKKGVSKLVEKWKNLQHSY